MKNLKEIEKEIIQAANNHLHAKTAKEALGHFTDDVIAVSNDKVFYSIIDLKKDVQNYYDDLMKVNSAEWNNIDVKVLNENTGIFNAKFSYTFTDMLNNINVLNGIWTAVFIKMNNEWKICLRHETFSVE